MLLVTKFWSRGGSPGLERPELICLPESKLLSLLLFSKCLLRAVLICLMVWLLGAVVLEMPDWKLFPVRFLPFSCSFEPDKFPDLAPLTSIEPEELFSVHKLMLIFFPVGMYLMDFLGKLLLL
jgi:hypothetical protein